MTFIAAICSPALDSVCPERQASTAIRSVAQGLNRPCLRFPAATTATQVKSVLRQTDA